MRFVDNYGGMACSKQRYEHGATLEGDGCSGNYFEERGGGIMLTSSLGRTYFE